MFLGKENEQVEFKESTAEFDKACKAIVAILNKSGEGTIYFGVKDNGEVIGHLIGKETLSTLTDRIKDSIKPSIYPVVKKESVGSKDIIVVNFKGNNKPYSYKGAFYIRVEQQNLIADPLIIRELIKESHEYNDKWENELTDYGIEYIDHYAVDNFYRQSVAMGRINRYDHTSEELLTQLKLMVNGKFTNAGYYLFSNNNPIVVKAVQYPTEERIDPIDLKRFEGNIFNLINESIGYISGAIKWRAEINSIERKDIPEIPIVALREIVINSFVHCDFISDTEHQITIDPSNVEIYNPGYFGEYTPRDYIETIIPSRTKHKVIQGIVFKAFDIETLGRGFKRMDIYCKKYKVKWDYRKYPFGFAFVFKRNNSLNDNDSNLSNQASDLLRYMENNDGKLDNKKKASAILKRKSRTVSTIINELIESGKIKRIGSNKTGYWRVID